ncbi:beta-ketoacyl-ACP synthase III [Caldalkalibacillus mannanilyticus]|uniref:beta-ketoacyl-ACP synthase III n=1 Tax=Caldalkalibacillus mannanilyticus TaxID=1418 RepID=UPI0004690B8B|nr:beta-ketoacyl-ACP synthase III [Caldalkalibacillus mannanilyticus]
MTIPSVGILGTGSYLPEKKMMNIDLEKIVDTTDEWIVSRTGIKERRIVSDDQATSDLAYEASLKALQRAGITAEQLGLIIVATVTPDMTFPSTANLIQERLGAKKAASFDLAAACSGFLYGLTMASQSIRTGLYQYALVIGAESLSKIVDWEDRNTSVLFGDGAGAVVLGKVDEGYGFLSFELGADGGGGDFLYLPGGGSRCPATEKSVKNKQHYVKMNGKEVFKFAVRVMEQVSESVLEKAGLLKEDVALLVPHQANLRIIDAARKRLELPEDKVVVNLDKYGNMSSASIPVALDEAVRGNQVKRGDHLVLVGFGGGLTWGGCVIRWDQEMTSA